MTRSIVIVDTTLRDGEQAPGVAFTRAERAELAALLVDAGVVEIEVGTPAMGEEEREAIRGVAALNLPAALTCWARATERDIDAAAECGTPYVHISFPISRLQLELVGGREDELLGRAEALIGRALASFDGVSVGALDATRADVDLLVGLAQTASTHGARRLRIADTVGVGRPALVARLFERLAAAAPGLELEFHGHDDLGLATANTLAAIEGGATAASVTVNGLGERAGNAALEQVVMALKVLYGSEAGIDLAKLPALCRRVAECSGRPIPSWRPVVGDEIFTHESGIHVAALLKNPHAYQPFLPQELGAGESRFAVGKHSGSAALRYVLHERGIELEGDLAGSLLAEVRRAAEERKRELSVDEVEQLYRILARIDVDSVPIS